MKSVVFSKDGLVPPLFCLAPQLVFDLPTFALVGESCVGCYRKHSRKNIVSLRCVGGKRVLKRLV